MYSPAKNSGKFVGSKKSVPNANTNKDSIETGGTQPNANLMQQFGNSASFDKSSSLIGRQVEAEAASVDEKIEKL